jgi:SAM-dependent methyltransferase
MTIPSHAERAPIVSEEENAVLVRDRTQVDRLNGDFYSRYPYPWSPQTFDFVADRQLPRLLLNQNLGDWRHATVPPQPRIWVAGCGTNQAIYVALRHPDARIVASDLSPVSLDICRSTIEQLGLSSVELRRETINDAPYRDEFDLVICTGVIHHNAEPLHALTQLRAALKPSGVLELMVYNRFQRAVHSVFQKALRMLAGTDDRASHRAEELRLARRLVEAFPVKNRVHALLQAFRAAPESALADALIQPVEHSYTVESLAAMAQACGLEILRPAPNEWDAFAQPSEWHMAFPDAELQQAYERLPDVARWQATNLLLLERSPQLWFYLQRTDAERSRRTEADVNAAFLETVFEPVRASRGHYRRGADGTYRRAAHVSPYPTGHPDESLSAVYQAVDGERDMQTILRTLDVPLDFSTVLRCRTHLATSAFPFLVARATG